MMKADSFSPSRRQKIRQIEVVKPCVVEGRNIPAGDVVKTNQVDADMLIFNGLAKVPSSQASEPRRGRPPKE